MNVIPKLGNFPDMMNYMNIYSVLKHKFKLAKVIWFSILKNVIESWNLEVLIDILHGSKADIHLSIQLTDDIFSTIHFFNKKNKFIDQKGQCHDFHIEDEVLRFGSVTVSTQNIYKINLVADENFIFSEGSFVANSEKYDDGKIVRAHGQPSLGGPKGGLLVGFLIMRLGKSTLGTTNSDVDMDSGHCTTRLTS